MKQYLVIGKIVNTHGVKGELKILPLTDDVNRFKKLSSLLIDIDNNLVEYKIETLRIQSSVVLTKLAGVNDMDSAQKLKGLYIKINRADANKLPKDSYYISDLIGLTVNTEENEYLGTIKDIVQPGGNDVYVVTDGDKELLIPAIKDVVKSVDLENKIMTVKLLEGLKDI